MYVCVCVCDKSVQQTATKPQTQWKGMLFGCEQPFLWGERCVTSQKMAAEETRGVGDLTFFEALMGGAFDHLNWQHSREFDQNFSKKSNALGFARGGG